MIIKSGVPDHISIYILPLIAFERSGIQYQIGAIRAYHVYFLQIRVGHGYFDLTRQAEFLYTCAEETIERIIPEELDYLEKYDRMTNLINARVTLPDTKVDLLIKLLNQNEGKLSKKRREKEFAELTDVEILEIEDSFQIIFHG